MKLQYRISKQWDVESSRILSHENAAEMQEKLDADLRLLNGAEARIDAVVKELGGNVVTLVPGDAKKRGMFGG